MPPGAQQSQTAAISYATHVHGEPWGERAIRFAFLFCGVVACVSLCSAMVAVWRNPGFGGEYADSIRSLCLTFAPSNGWFTGQETRLPAWANVLRLPIPLLLLLAGLRSRRPRLSIVVRLARALAAGLLTAIAVGEWITTAGYWDEPPGLRWHLAEVARLLVFNVPLVPLLTVTALWNPPARNANAAAISVVLAAYAASMCLHLGGMVEAIIENADHGSFGVPAAYPGLAKLFSDFFDWLVDGLEYGIPDVKPAPHMRVLLWASTAGALVAAGCVWTNRLWLRRIAAATLLPAIAVCGPGRLFPWFDIVKLWFEPGDDGWVSRLFEVNGNIEAAAPTLPLIAFATIAVVTLWVRPPSSPDAFTDGGKTGR